MKLGGLKIATIAAAVLLVGCAQFRSHKGVVIDPQLAAGVQPGVDNKDSVAKTLGRPSFAGTFSDNDWYYVSRDNASRLPTRMSSTKSDHRSLRPEGQRRFGAADRQGAGVERCA